MLLLAVPLIPKSLQAGKDEKLSAQVPECFRKGVRRVGGSPTPILAAGKKLVPFPRMKSEKNIQKDIVGETFILAFQMSPLAFRAQGPCVGAKHPRTCIDNHKTRQPEIGLGLTTFPATKIN